MDNEKTIGSQLKLKQQESDLQKEIAEIQKQEDLENEQQKEQSKVLD